MQFIYPKLLFIFFVVFQFRKKININQYYNIILAMFLSIEMVDSENVIFFSNLSQVFGESIF